MATKKYEVLKNFYLIQVFYPKGSTLEAEEVIAKQYVDLDVLKEKIEPKPETKTLNKSK